MNDVIFKILDIEKKAQKITEDIKSERDNMQENINMEVKALQDDINSRAKVKIEKLERENIYYREQKVDVIEKQGEKRIKDLESKANKSKEKWAELIFQNIIQ